jgi:hypothetical protein
MTDENYPWLSGDRNVGPDGRGGINSVQRSVKSGPYNFLLGEL